MLPKTFVFRTIVTLMLIAWIVEIIEEKKKDFYKVKFAIPLMVILLTFILSTIFSLDPRMSLWGYGHRADGLFSFIYLIIFFFIVATHFQDSKKIHWTIDWLIKASVIVCGYGILQHFGIDFIEWTSDKSRIISTLGNALLLGNYLIMIIPITLSWLIYNQKIKTRIYLSIILILQLITLVLTLSRSAWLALIAGLMFFFFLVGIKQKKKIVWSGILVLVIISLIFSGLLITQKSLTEALSHNKYTQRFVSSFTFQDASTLARLVIWKTSLELIINRPFLGHGAATFLFGFNKNYPPEIVEYVTQNVSTPHNHFLYWAYAHGLISFIIYLCFIIYVFYSGIKLLLKTKDNLIKWLVCGALSGILCFYIQMQFSIISPTIYLYLFFLFGLIAAFWQKQASSEDQAQDSLNKYQAIKTTSKNNIYIYIGVLILGTAVIAITNILPFAASIIGEQQLNEPGSKML
jgi:putative inorganic carbon (HCO3(-)) transporter